MREITIPPTVFIGHRYLKHAGGGWKRTIVYVTTCNSHLIRMACTKRLNYRTAGSSVWIPRFAVQTAAGTAEGEQRHNSEDSEDANDSDRSGEEESGSEEEESDEKCISGDKSENDMKGCVLRVVLFQRSVVIVPVCLFKVENFTHDVYLQSYRLLLYT